jgi:hypothetical protein
VEVFLKDSGVHKTTDDKIEGQVRNFPEDWFIHLRRCTNIMQIVVKGPSVAGGEVNVGVAGKIRHDNTLAYA